MKHQTKHHGSEENNGSILFFFFLHKHPPLPLVLFCRPGDLLLARDGGEGGRQYGLRQRIEKQEGGPLTCRLVLWEDGDDVHSAFENELRELLNVEPLRNPVVSDSVEGAAESGELR